ncbi:PEP-CTERM sorting domain-containing protein [Aphanothece sacrum]|uniref:Hemolysin-type calcium-binding repeat family protein n=1 Tax=Aphanothece sacrum FPU1 TaxID=1920663 RepID=A0A401IDE7_APHSA|nr:PEP-CTERM sorting domain-containing protein [Aphanothece sacrum]GBF79219.1 hemolysin-type calcium-binding repeat family protein [Aphanothece sacrum FPU1]GBF86609.1 hemolysin-type calcium-binding protein [Aphanothece sacrum FPU3]
MKKPIKILLGLQVALVSGVTFMVQPSHAAILWDETIQLNQNLGIGGVVKVNPFWGTGTSFTGTRLLKRSDTNFAAFDEAQNVLLSRDINTTAKNSFINPKGLKAQENNYFANKSIIPNKFTDLLYDWDNITNLDVIKKDRIVDSHIIYLFDTASNTSRINVKSTIIFDDPIIGLMGDPSLINITNSLLVPNYTSSFQNTPTTQTLEGLQWADSKTADYVKIKGENRNILELDWSTQGFETLRIITEKTPIINPAVTTPEPLTMLGAATAMGFGTFFRRIKKKVK